MSSGPADRIQAAIDYIDRRLATIDKAPGTWGSPESLELQTLLLFEIRHFLLRPRTYVKNPYEARRAFFRFVRKHIENAGAGLMSAQISAARVEQELPRLLGIFRDEVALRIEAEPEPIEGDKGREFVRGHGELQSTSAEGTLLKNRFEATTISPSIRKVSTSGVGPRRVLFPQMKTVEGSLS
jgi:hypothetical protein